MTATRTAPATVPRTATRRTVARSAVWSVPVVAMAATAPAYAASPCDTTYPFRLDWGTTSYAKNGENGTATVTASGATAVNVSFTSAIVGTVTRAAANLTVPTTLNVGGLGANERALRIEHAQPITAGRANRQSVTISFSRAVTGLSFTITDIDSMNSAANNQTRNGWWDQVELSGARTAVRAANLTGSGTQASPWEHTSDNTNVAVDSNAGNITVTYPGTVTSITLTYWSDSAGGNQAIALSDFTFNALGC